MKLKHVTIGLLWCFISLSASMDSVHGQQTDDNRHPQFSGVYPHLALWNPHNECGIGAVVPWSGKLWVITYAPHFPRGSRDKLYSITPELEVSEFDGSVGGTAANRMIHRETNQLVIGPYVIDNQGNVRVIPPTKMVGRLTGNARHLIEPEKKTYFATMEEGIYEVDMATLDVTELFADDQSQTRDDEQVIGETARLMSLPGYHGKGLYSGQGRLIYANNGEASSAARANPETPSGVLAEWDGKSDQWKIVRRNQFVDVRGPGGLFGNPNPETDPLWAIGWDHRSLILMLLDGGRWYTYRLPKASHCYDGAHGWNTEWPRFQDIGENDFAMNMHGMFWRFPKTFAREDTSGIKPRSTYLKVIGDYCRWNDRLVFGCDDTAKSEFLNKRRAKGAIAAPGQSHSNLWFTSPSILDELGPPIGRGAVWIDEVVPKNRLSDPFLFAGFERRIVHIANHGNEAVTFRFVSDAQGENRWQTTLHTIQIEPESSAWHLFAQSDPGTWLRVVTDEDCWTTVQFHYSNADRRTTQPDRIFAAIAKPTARELSGGLLRVRGDDCKTLAFVGSRCIDGTAKAPKLYELDELMKLKVVDDQKALDWTLANVSVPSGILQFDNASVAYVDDDGSRWRLPKGDVAFDQAGPLGNERIDREVATERDLFNCHGTFYELPAGNAGGFSRIRPICTHNRRIKDYCSYRGLLILSGIDDSTIENDPHVVRSNDGEVALWAGVIDDLWKFGKPVGVGGPWNQTNIIANQASDPYLMTGYDRKLLQLSHSSTSAVTITAEVDITGTGIWTTYKMFKVPANEIVNHEFPDEFAAYWIRFKSSTDTEATVWLIYD